MVRRSLAYASIALALSASIFHARAQTPELKLASGAAGGTFFDYGSGLAKLVEAKSGLRVVVSPSGGSIENLRRIEDGSADLALVAMGPAFEAWTASAAPWAGSPPLKKSRALVPMYETPFHLATIASTGIKTVQALDGKKVGVGPKGGANEIIFAKMAEGLGIKPTLIFGDPGALADKVISQEIDATFFGAGAPIPAYSKIADASSIVFLPIDGAAQAAIRKAFPYLTVGAIPADSYRGQNAPIETVALWNFLVGRADLPADQMYLVVKAVLSDAVATNAIHPAATATRASNVAANTFMTFHPGATRFYDEIKTPIAPNLR